MAEGTMMRCTSGGRPSKKGSLSLLQGIRERWMGRSQAWRMGSSFPFSWEGQSVLWRRARASGLRWTCGKSCVQRVQRWKPWRRESESGQRWMTQGQGHMKHKGLCFPCKRISTWFCALRNWEQGCTTPLFVWEDLGGRPSLISAEQQTCGFAPRRCKKLLPRQPPHQPCSPSLKTTPMSF